MNIALIGYGKMGRVIETIAEERGHTIVAKVNSEAPIEQVDFSQVDVAIEFTAPDLAVKHIYHCVDRQTPVVVGTTAWGAQLDEVTEYVNSHGGSLLHASNFSIGVNIFFEINRRLASLMEPHTGYEASMEETHHLQKLDAPSGTAITLANDMMFENKNLSSWVHKEEETPRVNRGQIALTSYREEGVPGTHKIQYQSDIDTIEIKHTAHNRRGFALGSVVAAEWLFTKKGVFTMKDIIS
ncbi:MAG: 4-hydroxy-tetrahydrodipicolinate reductase [Fluviicola sp. XM-24bin1]|nr:MAG: 4-hydroxy-tetrahydrodipicolinate reductase [Fluviicola sp. XM-24bin1]